MTVTQMDILAGIVLFSRFEIKNMPYEEIIGNYEGIRKTISELNVKENDNGQGKND